MIGKRIDPGRLFFSVLLVLLPVTSLGYAQVSFGLVVAAFAYPMLATTAWRLSQFRVLTMMTMGALVSAPIMIWYITYDPQGRAVNDKEAFHDVMTVVTALVLIAAILTAAQWLSPRSILCCVSSGLILEQVLDHSVWKGNAWKYAFALPVAFLVLAGCRRMWTAIGALAVLAAVSAVSDYRSFIGFALFAVVIVWIFRRPKAFFTGHPARYVAAAIATTVVVFQVYQWSAVNGLLGADIQARTLEQTANGQSILEVARPEWRATLHLMSVRPLGYAPGLEANAADVYGVLTHLGPNATNSGYVTNYILGGGGIGLHSTLADEWLKFGVFGLLMVAYMAYLLLRRLAEQLAIGRPTLLDAFLPVTLLWDVLFSPESAMPRIALGVGLAMLLMSAQPRTARDLGKRVRRQLIPKLAEMTPSAAR